MSKTVEERGTASELPAATFISSPPTAVAPTASHDEIRDATEEEIKNLRHVVDKLPHIIWIALMVGAAERFTYYAITAPWQNYMQNRPGKGVVPGALGLGQSTATNIYNAYYFFSFLTPVPFAIISDVWLGRYKTLCISLSLYLCGCLVQFVTSLPTVLGRGGGIPGLAVSMILIGLGVGGAKATISPFIGDQYKVVPPQVKATERGERVIVDRTLTIQYIYNVFYWLINVAGLSLVASTYLEKYRGFWTAYLLALCSTWIGIALLLTFSKEFVKIPAQGNVLTNASKVLVYSSRDKFKLDAANPQYQLEKYGRTVPWTDHFIAEIKRGLLACRVMAWFVLFYLGFNQISNNLVSQAGEMQLTGIPNDGIQALNPIACVILGPIIQKILYPTLARHRISFGPIARMTIAFLTMAAAMAYAAGVQKLIYKRGPCYNSPLHCDAAQRSDGQAVVPNAIKVWVQAPVYVVMAFAEIFGFTTLSEYSFSKAPRDMRTVVQALRQVTAGMGSALGMALSPVAEDPKVLWLYVGLAISMALTAPVFWGLMGRYDRVDEELNALDLSGDKREGRDEERRGEREEQDKEKDTREDKK